MNQECHDFEPRIESLLAGDISDGDFKKLLAHAASCRLCRTPILLHFHLSAPGLDKPEADEEDMAWMRQNVKAAMEQTPGAFPSAAARPVGWTARLQQLAAGLLAAAIGLTAGWLLFGGDSGKPLLGELTVEAAGNRRLVDSTESPYLISNVSLQEVNGQLVTVDFDVTTHLEVTRRRDDPLIQEVLVQALLAPANAGESLRAIRFSEKVMNTRVKEALLFAARHDSNTGVRLRALETAMQLSNDSDVQQVCIEILTADDSTQMRLLAVDYLAETSDGSRVLESYINNDQSEAGVPVRMRAASYLQ